MEAKSLEAAVGNMSLNDSDLPISSQSSHEFGNDLLPLDSLYKLCMRYYKGIIELVIELQQIIEMNMNWTRSLKLCALLFQ